MNIGGMLSGQHAPEFALLDAALAGPNLIIPGIPGKSIIVVRYGGIVAKHVDAKFQSFDGDSTYTDLQGVQSYVGNQPLTGGEYCPVGLFACLPGQALVLDLSAPVQVGGQLTYFHVY
jgi:hypothetical protein